MFSISTALFNLNGHFLHHLLLLRLQNFTEYLSLYPEFSYVFIGDNGQADVRAAELMMEEHREQIDLIFIHMVQVRRITSPPPPPPSSDC
jgi:hypothetical protein